MEVFDIQPDEAQVSPVVTNRVFHWEDISFEAREAIREIIDGDIEEEIMTQRLKPGSDLLEAEIVIQVSIHTQIAEY